MPRPISYAVFCLKKTTVADCPPAHVRNQHCFFYMTPRPHTSTLFPYTTLFRSIKHSVDRFVIVSIFIPKLRLILILNSFLGSSDSLVFSELFHSLAPKNQAVASISDFLLSYLAT